MKINKELISNIDDQGIYLVSIKNDNNYSVSFSNFGVVRVASPQKKSHQKYNICCICV